MATSQPATNPYDQFDSPATQANPYDKFDTSSSTKVQQSSMPESQGGILNGVVETVKNIGPSGIDMAKNIVHAISHPVNTVNGILDIGAGALQAAFAPESWKKSGNKFLYDPHAAQAFDAAVKFYKDRYGSWDNFLNTVKKDPVGVAMDVSAGTGILSRVARIASLDKTAGTLAKISAVTDPVRQTAKVVRGVARPAYQYTVGLTTGSGAEAIKQALKGGDAFKQAMRGKISETDVLDTAKSALQRIKDERGATYRTQLAQLSKNKTPLDITDIQNAADSWLSKYGIKKTNNGLDFSRSTLRNNPAAAKEVTDVFETIKDWGSKPGDTTPLGLDTLKRVISDSYTSQQPSRAMVGDLANKVRTKIVREVPEYGDMTRNYAIASEIIDDMNRGLSLSDKAATDTGLRKLITAMREDKTFRRSLIDKLDKTAGTDVAGAVSGLLMKNPWSNRLGPIAHFYGTSAVAAYARNPLLMTLLPAASPRLMGEVSMGIGKAGGMLPSTSPLYQGAFQAGRLPYLPGVDTPQPQPMSPEDERKLPINEIYGVRG